MNWMKLFVLAVTALITIPMSIAQGATCTSNATADWTVITDASAWNCSPTAADDFIIASGFTVTITSGSTVTQDGAAASTGVTVQSGGTLIMQAGSKLDLNVDGLDCQAGSTCTFTGAYRQIGITSPGTSTTPGTGTRWYAGSLDLCPGADCALASLSYALADYEITSGPGITFLEAAIDAIDLTDILCWWSLPDTNKRPPVDEGFCYEISASETDDPYSITFEVRQGTRAQDGFPLARRDILSTALTVAVNPGDRVFTIAIGDFPSDDYYNGRMIRFEDGTSGNPQSTSYRIMDSEENGASADTIEIADARGIVDAHASSDEIWIDYGWQEGDTFLIIQPARITSATSAEEDSDIILAGTYTLTAVVFQETGGVRIGANATDAGFNDVWLQDVTDSTTAALAIDATSTTSYTRLSITGGSITSGNDVNHSIVPDGSAGDITLDMVAIRHAGDDYLSLGETTSSFSVDRFRCQFRSTNGVSQGCLAGPSNKTFGEIQFNATNIEVLDALSGSGAFTNWVNANNVLIMSSIGAVHQAGNGTTGPANNAYIVGNDFDSNGAATFPMVGNHFVSRDNVNSNSGGSLQKNALALNARNGLVIGNTFDQIGIDGSAGLIENVAFIDNIATNANNTRMFYLALATHPSFVLRNILLVDRVDEIKYGIFANAPSTTLANVIIDKFAFFDFNSSGAVGFQDSIGAHVAHNRGTNLCFFDLATEANSISAVSESNSWLRGIPPDFVAPERTRYDVRPGTAWHDQECGIKPNVPVGVCKMNRTLAWSNLEPECMADFDLGGGGGGRSPHSLSPDSL